LIREQNYKSGTSAIIGFKSKLYPQCEYDTCVPHHLHFGKNSRSCRTNRIVSTFPPTDCDSLRGTRLEVKMFRKGFGQSVASLESPHSPSAPSPEDEKGTWDAKVQQVLHSKVPLLLLCVTPDGHNRAFDASQRGHCVLQGIMLLHKSEC